MLRELRNRDESEAIMSERYFNTDRFQERTREFTARRPNRQRDWPDEDDVCDDTELCRKMGLLDGDIPVVELKLAAATGAAIDKVLKR